VAEVALRSVSKHFDGVTAVDELSLTVGDAEFVVLLGPTGAGKTTTLRLVAGLERPDGGHIHIAGTDVTSASIAARDVAFVFQQYSLYPHYTVFDNLAFPLRSPRRRCSREQIREKATQVAQLLRIEDKLNNKATELSGGEMQRVAIGRALVREPAIFLMDEPLSSLDAKLREDLRVELKRIQADLGATVLYVTHDHVEAMTLADRIGVLASGRLMQLGTPKEIYDAPNSVYVAQRLGSPPVNLLPVGMLGVNAPAKAECIGVRPEDLVLGNGGVPAHVIQVEHLGAETVVVMEVADRHIRALAGAEDALQRGQQTRVSVRPGAALFFDRDGRRLDALA